MGFFIEEKMQKNSSSGMSLVELMMTILIVTIALWSVGELMKQSGIVGQRGKENDIATEIMHKKMESIRDESFYLITNETFTANEPELRDAAGTVTITEVDPDSGWLKLVGINMSWKKWSSDIIMHDTIVTYITRQGINP